MGNSPSPFNDFNLVMRRLILLGIACSIFFVHAQELPQEKPETFVTDAFVVSADQVSGILLVSEICEKVERGLKPHFNRIRGYPERVEVRLLSPGEFKDIQDYRLVLRVTGEVRLDICWSENLKEHVLWQCLIESWLMRWRTWFLGPNNSNLPLWLIEGLTYELLQSNEIDFESKSPENGIIDISESWNSPIQLMRSTRRDIIQHGLFWEYLVTTTNRSSDIRSFTSQIVSEAPPLWALFEGLNLDISEEELTSRWFVYWNNYWLHHETTNLVISFWLTELQRLSRIVINDNSSEMQTPVSHLKTRHLSDSLRSELESRILFLEEIRQMTGNEFDQIIDSLKSLHLAILNESDTETVAYRSSLLEEAFNSFTASANQVIE